MAQLVKLSLLFAYISLLHLAVLSHPTVTTAASTTTPAAVTSIPEVAAAATGAGIGTTGINAAISGNVADNANAIGAAASEAAKDAAEDAGVVINGIAAGLTDAVDDGGKLAAAFTNALSGSGAGMLQLGTGVPTSFLTAMSGGGNGGSGFGLGYGTNGVGSGLGLGTNGLGSLGSGSGLGFGGTLPGISLNSGLGGLSLETVQALQRQFGNLSPYQIQALVRAGVLGAIDMGDSSSEQFNRQVIRPFALNTAGQIDRGFSSMGIQNPVATPLATGIWQMGENGRENAFDYSRNLAGGRLNVPGLFSQTSGAGGTGGLTLALPTGSFQAGVN